MSRQHYRLVELQRWREIRQLPLNLRPTFWPFPASLADRLIIAFDEMGCDPSEFAGKCMRAVWAEERDLSQKDVLVDIAQSCHLPIMQGLERVENDADSVQKLYQSYTQEAIDMGSFGVPNYILNGELFWGQDRLELLEQALQSGRAPYRFDA